LEISRSKWTSDSGIAIVVALLCIAVAAFLWSKPVSNTIISLTVETESLQAGLDQAWHIESPFQTSFMHFERLASIQAPNLGLSIDENQGNAWIRLEGGQITLQSLDVEKDASFHLTSDKDQVSMFVSLKPLRGTITVIGHVAISAGPNSHEKTLSRHYSLDVPETIQFAVTDPKAVPSRITIHGPGQWRLGRIPIKELNFTMENVRGPAETELTSGAKSGSIRFSDSSWPPYEISESELLAVNETDQAAVEVRGAGPLMHVTLNGSIKEVIVGGGEGKKKLVPTYLEYLYNKKTLAFFWGAVVFTWGLLWGIRKTIFR
jgi:hypothetical protein